MIKFTRDEINKVFSFVNQFSGLLNDDDDYGEITLEEIQDFEADVELLKPLIGYQVKVEQCGVHYHDDQIVEYGFFFKNPVGEITEIWTEMYLIAGWNHNEDAIIQ